MGLKFDLKLVADGPLRFRAIHLCMGLEIADNDLKPKKVDMGPKRAEIRFRTNNMVPSPI